MRQRGEAEDEEFRMGMCMNVSMMGILHLQKLQTPKLSVGCPVLDRFLGGGIPCNTITELVAESGTGKTQLCLQLLLHSPSSLYLYSEFPFPLRRLQQLSSVFRRPTVMDDVLLRPLKNAYHLLEVLPSIDALLCERPNIKLIVIDSVAALFRSEFDSQHKEEMRTRGGLFFKIASEFKAQAIKHGVAVVMTNQVVDVVESSDLLRIGNSDCFYSSGRKVCAALGLSWAHCVNIRLFLCKRQDDDEQGKRLVVADDLQLQKQEKNTFTTSSSSSRRFIRVVFAPHLPDSCCQFVIKREGVFGIDG